MSINNCIAQPANDSCNKAQLLCVGEVVTADNKGATKESWNSSCYNVENSVWYTFITNGKGGDVKVLVSKIACLGGNGRLQGVLLKTAKPCNSSSFTSIDCFSGDNNDSFSLHGTALAPNSQYWIQLDGDELGGIIAECDFEISISGSAVERNINISITDVVCEVSMGSITVNASIENKYCTYYLDGNFFQDSGTFKNIKVGKHELITKDSSGCQYTKELVVEGLNNNLSINAGEDVAILSGESVILNAVSNRSFYRWYPSTGLSDSTVSNPLASPTSTRHYTVYTYTAEGCSAQASITVKVIPYIDIPDIFTPNGDGANDIWHIGNIEYFSDAEVVVFDRWGQKVFQSNNNYKNHEWDGKKNGLAVPAGVYYYIIDLKLKEGSTSEGFQKGTVTVIK